VKGSVPSETEKNIAHGLEAGNVGALTTLGSFAPYVWKEGKKKLEKKHNRQAEP
jgi:hypothetical protein